MRRFGFVTSYDLQGLQCGGHAGGKSVLGVVCGHASGKSLLIRSVRCCLHVKGVAAAAAASIAAAAAAAAAA